jgi:hypothetical protein
MEGWQVPWLLLVYAIMMASGMYLGWSLDRKKAKEEDNHGVLQEKP